MRQVADDTNVRPPPQIGLVIGQIHQFDPFLNQGRVVLRQACIKSSLQ